MLDIREKYQTASQDIERLQNISMATQAPPIIQTTSQPTTTTTTATTTSTTTSTTKGGLEFSTEDLLYSLSSQIGMMEEKLELCKIFFN